MDHSYRSYVNIMERKAIAEIRQRGLKKRYELVRKRLETEMQLEELEITMEFEEIEVLQKATRSEENLFAKNDVCNLCRATHKTVECPVLKTKSPEERFSLVWKLRLCLNCFDKNHIAQECDSGDRCEVAGCRKKHSTLLHQDELSKVSPHTQLAKQATREAVNQQSVVRDKHSGLGYNSNAPLQQAPDHSQLKDEVPKCPEAPTSHIQNSQLKASELKYSPNSLVRPQQQQNRLQSHSVQKDEPAKPPQAPVQQQPDANNKNIARAPQIHAKLRHQLSEGAPSRAETHTQTTRYCRPEEVSSQFVSRTDRRTEQTAQCRQPEGVNSQPVTCTDRNETHGNNEDVKKKEIHENEMVAPGDQSVIQRGSDSETSKEENQIHDQDNVGPEESASHCALSTIRASRAARRAAAEVRSRVAQQRAVKEFEMAVVRQEIAVLEAETEENSLRAGEEAFARVLRNTVTPASQWKGESSIDLRPGRRSSIESQRTEPSQVSQQWRKSKPASQQWETLYPASQQRETSYPASQQRETSYPASQQRETSYPASQQWETSYPASQQRETSYPASQQRETSHPVSQQRETSYTASQQWERPYPASQQWERPYPASQQRERSYLAPQQWKEELSLASHVDPQVTTQHNRGTARPDPSARVRAGAESPPPFPREEIVPARRSRTPEPHRKNRL